jgi:hypothetical protein
MAYIGNTNETQAFAPAVDYFNGNGSDVAFTLSRPVASVAQVQAVIENVPQNPGDAYTVSGNTITFTSAPPIGTGNIYVYYTSPITQVIQPGQGTVGTIQIANGAVNNQKLDIASTDGTGAMYVPTGTTAQRPSSPASGYTRYNTTTGQLEIYSTIGGWANAGTSGNVYTASYLVVAGGGGGGSDASNSTALGGGGAGGMITGTTTLMQGTVYSIVIGAGGTGGVSSNRGTNGSNSTFNALTAIGGGAGGSRNTTAGVAGGSGGGATFSGAVGAGTSGQGNNGGLGTASGLGGGGGGGGAGAVGTYYSGGAGLQSSITGTATFYAGGGGGREGTAPYTLGTGGAGGGGAGGAGGVANTGGGGGGNAGVGGGSGVVILSVPTTAYSGTTTGSPTVTTSGANTILQFNASGSYTA